MNGMIFIKPAKGMTIPSRDSKDPIGTEGAFVPNSSFYRRFIRRGEATKANPPRQATGKKTKAAKSTGVSTDD